ncbi:MAG: hypothetical protein EOO09_06870 [Chitinophagaceae bacterium]|nr:MAG: hypothetical protein EOO09_06870 [Chitinophagaceae bacterium]
MKFRTSLLCLSLLVSSICSAQKNFEGTVVYSLKENNKSQATLTIEFGQKGIAATFADDNGLDKEQILVLFDSLAVISMNTVEKTYRPKYYKLAGINTSAPPMIGGYKTRLVPVTGGSKGLGYMTGAAMYVSDDLTYEIPAEMKGADELIMVSDSRVVLGFMMGDRNSDSTLTFDAAWADSAYRGVIIKATSVKAHKQDLSLFTIPAGYTRAVPYDEMAMDEVMADSTMAMMDTAAAYDPDTMVMDTAIAELTPPPPPPAKKKPVKSPAKKPAKKASSPARKEGN